MDAGRRMSDAVDARSGGYLGARASDRTGERPGLRASRLDNLPEPAARDKRLVRQGPGQVIAVVYHVYGHPTGLELG